VLIKFYGGPLDGDDFEYEGMVAELVGSTIEVNGDSYLFRPTDVPTVVSAIYEDTSDLLLTEEGFLPDPDDPKYADQLGDS